MMICITCMYHRDHKEIVDYLDSVDLLDQL